MKLRIRPSNSGGRVDAWLAEELSRLGHETSRSGLKRLLENGDVTIEGKAVKPSYQIRPGDDITVIIPDPVESGVAAEEIPLDIVYEDAALIVVNKPQGMVVHPAPGHFYGTLVNALLFHCKGSLSGVNGILRPGIVHRIDRDTSGLLVAAKTDSAHRSLSEQLQARTMTRVYKAIAKGRISESVTIDKPIARNRNADRVKRKKMAVDASGRTAVTHIKPIQALERLGVYTLIEARLKTGRTHQIRVHMAHINRPILGDILYGGENQPFGLKAQVLHAGVLGFAHPESGEYMEFLSDPPAAFIETLDKLK